MKKYKYNCLFCEKLNIKNIIPYDVRKKHYPKFCDIFCYNRYIQDIKIKNYCIDCNKPIAKRSVRCPKCNMILRYLNDDIKNKISATLKKTRPLRHIIIICKFCKRKKRLIYQNRNNEFCSPNCATRFSWTQKKYRKFHLLRLNKIHKKLAKTQRRTCISVFYKQKNGKIIILGSSWELALAKRLDILHILWKRPKPIQWIDNTQKVHYYFPDFYLPKYKLYLDPKSNFIRKLQRKKLRILRKTIPNLILLNKKECINFSINKWSRSSDEEQGLYKALVAGS